MSQDKNLFVGLKVACPLCGKAFPKVSKKAIFNIVTEPINFLVRKVCPNCKASINQRYWSETGADGELRLCIGNRDDLEKPIATLSGILTSKGVLDPNKLKVFEKGGLKISILKDVPESIINVINKF